MMGETLHRLPIHHPPKKATSFFNKLTKLLKKDIHDGKKGYDTDTNKKTHKKKNTEILIRFL